MTATIFNSTPCKLGEGPLWHPLRNELFWFDILGKRLHSNEKVWQFNEHVSAAGWLDKDTLLIASESKLFQFDLETAVQTVVSPFEADKPGNRSNDGRADPFGGFWVGTMGKNSEAGAGAIYRWYGGTLEQMFDGITISNSICFAPDRSTAYFSDTVTRQIMRQSLDSEGWPKERPEVLIDLNDEELNPDGAVVDTKGCLWVAQWGAARVAQYAPDGTFMSSIAVPGKQASCPAFGGKDLRTLYVTTAAIGLNGPAEGLTYSQEVPSIGQAEHRVTI
ncbi:gluconolactonase [Sulfitobacter sp. SK012]|uniref:SMP-30/gluconolactonase/LRE family protein n=1 Tax=Sulfitobacter sp. SK012 TaxID=1389005 RepID=UPI000E09E5C6|nr:SMP-30/gluconolactonase/LRE family protein [Sulfitobacter sp. SK012]AXI44691.1 gluconolactonase [Sulfitobacter sp. SK012]